MNAVELRNSNRGETLRLPDDAKNKNRRYLIRSIEHSHGGYIRAHVTDARGANISLTLPNMTPVEVTP